MKQKHTIEEFMCWRRENLERLATSLSRHLELPIIRTDWNYVSNIHLAAECVYLCNRLDALETPITIVTESGGHNVDTEKQMEDC